MTHDGRLQRLARLSDIATETRGADDLLARHRSAPTLVGSVKT
jgi:hypothetical protein